MIKPAPQKINKNHVTNPWSKRKSPTETCPSRTWSPPWLSLQSVGPIINKPWNPNKQETCSNLGPITFPRNHIFRGLEWWKTAILSIVFRLTILTRLVNGHYKLAIHHGFELSLIAPGKLHFLSWIPNMLNFCPPFCFETLGPLGQCLENSPIPSAPLFGWTTSWTKLKRSQPRPPERNQ